MAIKAVLLNDTSSNQHHGCEKVISNLRKGLQKYGIEVVGSSYVGTDWQTNDLFKQKLKNSDIVIVNGEGTIHHTRKRGDILIKVGQYANQFGIPSVLINSTYQENSPDYKSYLEYFSLITVRESLSKQQLDEIKIKSIVVPDLTYYSSYNENQNRSEQIGFTDSVFDELSLDLLEYTKKDSKYIYLPVISQSSVPKILSRVGLRRLASEPRTLIEEVINKKRISKNLYHEFDEYLDKVKSLKLLVTARYHSLCFAIQTNTPFLALKSNSHKVEGLIQDIGLSNERIISLQDLSPELLKKYAFFTEEENSKINIFKAKAQEKHNAVFENIALIANQNKAN